MDFAPTNEILIFNKTTLRECVNIDIMEDKIYEGNENFFVPLIPASTFLPFEVVLRPRIASVIIIDNDGMLTN